MPKSYKMMPFSLVLINKKRASLIKKKKQEESFLCELNTELINNLNQIKSHPQQKLNEKD